MRLTNEMINILATKIVEELRKTINVEKEYNEGIPKLNAAYDYIEAYDRRIDILNKELSELRNSKSNILQDLQKEYGIHSYNTRKEDALKYLKDNLINKKIPSRQDIKTEILLSGNTDLSQLIETLVKKFTIK